MLNEFRIRPNFMIIMNSIYGLLEMGLPAILMLGVTPFLVNHMGSESFGLWNITIALLGLLGFVDLGTGAATTKYIAEYYQKKDLKALSSIVTISIGLNIATGLILTTLVYFLSPWIAGLFISPVFTTSELNQIIAITSMGFFPMLISRISLSIFRGFQNFKIPMLFNAIEYFLVLVTALILVINNRSITLIVMSTIIIKYITGIILVVTSYLQLRNIGVKVIYSSYFFRKLIGFMTPTTITVVARSTFTTLDRIVVASVLGFSASSYYILAIGVANKFSAFGNAVTQPLLPAFSGWNNKYPHRIILNRLCISMFLTSIASIAMAILLITFSSPILILWLGESTAFSVLPIFRILIAIYAIAPCIAPAFQAANGLGFPWINTISTSLMGVFTILFIYILGNEFGLIGAAWANGSMGFLLLIPILLIGKYLLPNQYANIQDANSSPNTETI